MLEAGLWLQEAGFRGVGAATREKEARWTTLHRKLRQEHDKLERKWTLRSRCGKHGKENEEQNVAADLLTFRLHLK